MSSTAPTYESERSHSRLQDLLPIPTNVCALATRTWRFRLLPDFRILLKPSIAESAIEPLLIPPVGFAIDTTVLAHTLQLVTIRTGFHIRPGRKFGKEHEFVVARLAAVLLKPSNGR
jgi:hypothetical protein